MNGVFGGVITETDCSFDVVLSELVSSAVECFVKVILICPLTSEAYRLLRFQSCGP